MKNLKHLLVWFVLLLSVNLKAQTQYMPILTDSIDKWFVIQYPDCYDCLWASFDIFTYGDTVINGNSYKKLYRFIYGNYSHHPVKSFTDSIWENDTTNFQVASQIDNVFFRQNETASKLYAYNSDSIKEYLISDLDLQLGDNYQLGKISATVSDVSYENGRKIINLIFDDNYYEFRLGYENLTFTEGIGTNMWSTIYFPPPLLSVSFSYAANVLCFKNENQFFHAENPSFFNHFECGWIDSGGGGTEEITNDPYLILVSKNNVEVLLGTNIAKTNVKLLSTNGICVYENNFFNTNKLTIPIYNLPNNVYILQVLDVNSRKTNTYKFIKK